MELRPYQRTAVEAVGRRLATSRTAMIVMATGTGKTVVFAEIARRWQGRDARRVLVLAHRKELVEQARKKLDGVSCDVMTVQGMSRRLGRTDPDAYGLVVIDECHHSHARSYRRVIEHFGSAKVLGVTATPERADGKSLASVFGSPAFEYTIKQGIDDGWLAPIRIEPSALRIDLSKVDVARGDYVQSQLGESVEPWLDAAAQWLLEHASDRRSVVFLPLVSTARKMVGACERVGLTAAEVDGDSPNREQVLADFAEGRYQVLCNAMLLTEGWDCPEVSCVMVLRPTKSRALYCQMIGRGTRTAPGKDDLLVPDVLAFGDEFVLRPWDVLGKEPPEKKPKKADGKKAQPKANPEASLARKLEEVPAGGRTKSVGRPRRGGRKERKSILWAAMSGFASGFMEGLRS